MRTRLIPVVVLALLVGAGAAAVFAVGSAADGPGDVAPVNSSEGVAPGECSLVHNVDACEEPPGQPPIRSDEGIDPNECNLVHNIDACSYKDCKRLAGDAAVCEKLGLDAPVQSPGEQPPVTSGDDIAPEECSLVHNVEAC